MNVLTESLICKLLFCIVQDRASLEMVVMQYLIQRNIALMILSSGVKNKPTKQQSGCSYAQMQNWGWMSDFSRQKTHFPQYNSAGGSSESVIATYQMLPLNKRGFLSKTKYENPQVSVLNTQHFETNQTIYLLARAGI